MKFRIAYLERIERSIEAPSLESAANAVQRLAGCFPFGQITILSVIPEGGEAVQPGDVIEEKTQ